MDDIREAIGRIPPVTRYFLGITFLLSFCMTYSILSPYNLVLDMPPVFTKFQIWRLITTFFFAGPFSMSFLFGMAMLYYTISLLEAHYGDRQADFATLLVFNALASILIAYAAGDCLIMQGPYVFSLMYVWTKYVPDR